MNSENYDYKKIELTIDKHELYQTFNVRISDLKFSKFVQKTIFYFLLVFSITYFTQGANYAILASVFLISCRLFYLNQQIVDESLLVIPSVGIQLTCHFMSGRKSFKTFEMKSIQDIVINESITMRRVMFYLCLIYKESNDSLKLEPLLVNILPKLEILEKIYKNVKPVLV